MTTLLTHPTATRLRDDDELVAAVRAGSDAAFEAIVARYGPALTAFARALLDGRHHDAEEAVQDAFLRGITALRRHPRQHIVLKPWLYTITRNACLDRLRRHDRTVPLEPVAPVLADPRADPYAETARREELRLVVGGLARLPERQRTALVLHALEGRTHEELAVRLDVSVGGSKALVHRARHRLAADLGAAA